MRWKKGIGKDSSVSKIKDESTFNHNRRHSVVSPTEDEAARSSER
jgi:hypothetical protein